MVRKVEMSKGTLTKHPKKHCSRSMVPDPVVEHGTHHFQPHHVYSASVGRGKVQRADGRHADPPPVDWLILAVVRIAYALVLGPPGKFPDVEPGQYSSDISRLTLAALWVPYTALQCSVHDVLGAQADFEFVPALDSSNIR